MAYFCFCAQAQQHNIAVYIAGLVIGTAPLCVTVMSPLVGYFVSSLAAAVEVCSSQIHLFYIYSTL